jgi:c-di-GMP phosphodiesterase
MDEIYVSKQKIFNIKKDVFAYELVFIDSDNQITSIDNNIKGTSQLIISAITSTELDTLLGFRTMAFINVDESIITKGILDVLDKDRFILNILEKIDLNEKVLTKLINYRKKGFRLSLEHFDSSAAMIVKFKRLFNYIDIIKMDVLLSQAENLEKVMQKFKGTRIKLLAQNIESKEEHIKYLHMGFDYFQGDYLNIPEIIEIKPHKEPAQFVILQLIRLIKENRSTESIESFIKQQADLSFKLIQFFNTSQKINVRVESLTQVITLMGRDKLLRWLLVYLYAEVSTNSASQTILELAMRRAERMEEEADFKNKDKAYLAGMFSMLGSIFETDIKDLMSAVKMDSDITNLVLHKQGIFASSLMRAEKAEKDYLKKVMLANFEKLSSADLIFTLEDGGIEIDKENMFKDDKK